MSGAVKFIAACTILIGLWAGSLQAADWPQWRGLNRDAVCTETGSNGKDEAGYSSIQISRAAGVKQYVQLTNKGLVGVSEAGTFLWGYNRIANRVANISMPVIDGDYIYGGHNHNKGEPICIEMKTGRVMSHGNQPGRGSGSVVYADGGLYFLYENGVAALVEATPGKYNLKGMFKLPKRPGAEGTAWAHPVVCDGKLYLRWADVLFCYDVKAP